MSGQDENKGAGLAGIVLVGWATSLVFTILATLALPVALLISIFSPDPEISW